MPAASRNCDAVARNPLARDAGDLDGLASIGLGGGRQQPQQQLQDGIRQSSPSPVLSEPSLSRLPIPEKRYFGVPTALLPILIDLYYTHLSHAPLLLYRPSLTRALELDTIRTDVLLSICALASRFYTDSKGAAVLVDSHFDREWAEAAGRMALRELESPKADNVVAFLNLALFWYSHGQFQRSNMLTGCASNTAWVIGVPSDEKSNGSLLDSEMQRRRFWGCYLQCSFQADTLFPKIPTEGMLNIRLPCSESELQLGVPQSSITLKDADSTQSIYAELVRAMALWSSVVLLIKQTGLTLPSRLAEMQTLDGRIHEAWSKLDPCFHLECARMAAVPSHELPTLLLLHVIYHQCLCSLHSSIVPLFSWSPCEGVFPYAQQLSAQTAFEHANSVSALLHAASELDWDCRRMPSFIGYAAYSACATLTPFLWCSQPHVRQRAISSVLASLKILQILGKDWAFLGVLGRFACGLYKVHASAPFPLTDEPKNMTPDALREFKPASSRARLSILTHNSIIISDQGSTAQAADDIGDLGLENADSREPGPAEENIAGFIAQMSREIGATSSQLPITIHPFLPSETVGSCALDGSFNEPTIGPDMDQFGHIDDFILDLMRQEGLLQQGAL
ncbi:hypothetical protein ASPWEDRAFT_175548 [Aspergillus wentii DTO 134E9]|uniref:Transcription factor domain-containing protein n=1 Tax=Aspergillus wentii DTO 134E9 TaxID=1073089 RepID=A0A1L9RBK3_ASPWE|nr:uncharacterized protein ASPWEDRAFT_175548 [Aspergillus wentii DTO 134E9]OJJ32253.1 hypothetical protein ASPWEDRAFT_175548 [Aspergillus wentii DTO 134E9]